MKPFIYPVVVVDEIFVTSRPRLCMVFQQITVPRLQHQPVHFRAMCSWSNTRPILIDSG